MRVTAAVPGVEAWIEFTEFWTRADLRRVFDLVDQEFLDFLAGKTTACYLETVEGAPITQPADLSVFENYDRLDLRVVQFLSQAILQAAGEAMAAARNSFFCAVSSPAPGTSQTPETP